MRRFSSPQAGLWLSPRAGTFIFRLPEREFVPLRCCRGPGSGGECGGWCSGVRTSVGSSSIALTPRSIHNEKRSKLGLSFSGTSSTCRTSFSQCPFPLARGAGVAAPCPRGPGSRGGLGEVPEDRSVAEQSTGTARGSWSPSLGNICASASAAGGQPPVHLLNCTRLAIFF